MLENIHLHTTGCMVDGKIDMSGFATVSGQVCMYQFNHVHVAAYYNEKSQYKECSISM